MDACPEGWHLPSFQEFEELIVFLGDWQIAGRKMTSTEGWQSDLNGDNASGFNAFPAGWAQLPELKGYATAFWTSHESNNTYAGTYELDAKDQINGSARERWLGLSVRCIKD